MKSRWLRIAFPLILASVVIYPLVLIGLSHFINGNTLEVSVSEDLKIQDLRIKLSIRGTDVVDEIIFEQKQLKEIPEGYGENDWYLSYKDNHTTFRHFKTKNVADHDYRFYFFNENDTIKCEVQIEGRNSQSTIVSLDKAIKTDVGSELGLIINRN